MAKLSTTWRVMDLTLLHINRAWVVLRAVTIRVSCPHGVSRVGSAREREFSFWSRNKSFIIDQACWVKMSVYYHPYYHPDPGIKGGGAVLKFFFYSFSIRKLDVLCSLHNSRFMREASLTRHFTPNARKARIARWGEEKLVSRFAAAFASLCS